MKILVSLSDDTSSLGVYSNVKPLPDSEVKLRSLFELVAEIEPHVDDLHCTVLYSRNDNNILTVPEGEPFYEARPQEVITWVGHNKKLYLILLLNSASLQKAHSDWRALGYTGDFNEYRPHITIKKEVDPDLAEELVGRLNAELRANPLELVFDAQDIQPLKE